MAEERGGRKKIRKDGNEGREGKGEGKGKGEEMDASRETDI